MTIQVLLCRADGTQLMENRRVPENWFPAEPTGSMEPERQI